LLVAPVIVKGQTEKKVIFPKGEWIGFNDLKIYSDSAEVAAPIDSLPLFVKAGSIITMTAPITNTSQYDGKSLILKYYMGTANAIIKSQWFYDNGTDPNSLQKRQYDLVTFTSSGTGNEHYISIKPEHLISSQKKFKLEIPGKRVRRVKFSNRTKYTVVGNMIYFSWNGHPLQIDIKTL
jgi:alpha-glucosidase (family GH31 glycosyl hydrolase)